ncbi:hypothetical protein [Massilia sp. BSC265]|uniref:hypothetical protein n=1 Tax=Massilia sp. BSC265 TaxID=1549812 RepID=UPI0004E8B5EB|nr:hypothetical protein [Massilia sp. BSC265]KFI06042.1 hypothetical protein JN27_18185 [Massilia sp. BSC265]
MPFFLSPEQKQSAFWLALGLMVALLLYTLGPILPPFMFVAAVPVVLARVRVAVLEAVCRYARSHYLGSSFYNA